MPCSWMSSTYRPCPRMKRGSSLRFIEWPIPQMSGEVRGWLIVSSCGGGRAPALRNCRPPSPCPLPGGERDHDSSPSPWTGGGSGRGWTLRLPQLLGRVLHGLHDIDVAGAPAQVPGDGLPDLRLAGVAVL